jgi:uncharacterized membrane protein AbrB (regulator of aidB expression)
MKALRVLIRFGDSSFAIYGIAINRIPMAAEWPSKSQITVGTAIAAMLLTEEGSMIYDDWIATNWLGIVRGLRAIGGPSIRRRGIIE